MRSTAALTAMESIPKALSGGALSGLGDHEIPDQARWPSNANDAAGTQPKQAIAPAASVNAARR